MITVNTVRACQSQAIYNILINAYKFTDPGSEARIDCEVTENAGCIYIEDNGTGMSEEEQQHIFEMRK